MPRKLGNDPKRIIALQDKFDKECLKRFAKLAQYCGSPYHLCKPQAKGFDARAKAPNKSPCDGNIALNRSEAGQLLREGISRSMISTYCDCKTDFPKYVWAVKDGHVFEAKISKGTHKYHGYELLEDDSQRDYVMNAWNQRCPMN